jgi:hypothetical protein
MNNETLKETIDSIKGKNNYQAGELHKEGYWPNPQPYDLPDTKPDWRDE